jgi:hypothetical protein
MKVFKQKVGSLLTAGTLGALLASSPVLAGPLFVVDQTVAGSAGTVEGVDRISFEYHARIDQTIVGGSLAGGDDPFREDGFLTKAAFGSPTGGSVPSELNATGGYGMYGLFTITGEADPLDPANPLTGGIQANFGTLSMTLFIDPDQNTTLALSGAGPVVPGGTVTDDFAIVNFTLGAGEAHIFDGLANGDFDTLLNVSLTPNGQAFFVDPDPFFPLENFGGNTETFAGGNLTTSFVATADGGGIELFQVPEPGTLALLGLGIMGMGLINRRRIKNA